jgi:hypothetical protein
MSGYVLGSEFSEVLGGSWWIQTLRGSHGMQRLWLGAARFHRIGDDIVECNFDSATGMNHAFLPCSKLGAARVPITTLDN